MTLEEKEKVLDEYLRKDKEGYDTPSEILDNLFMTHDELIEELEKILPLLTQEKVVKLFLASLSSRNTIWRSALAAYAKTINLPKHKFVPYRHHDSRGTCEICGIADGEWQGTFRMHVFGEYFDAWAVLALAAQEKDLEPEKKDLEIMQAILKIIRELPAKAKPSDLEKAISKTLKSNFNERQELINNLGEIGILETKTHKGQFKNYNTHFEIQEKNKPGDTYWSYPVMWWHGEDGINEKALKFYFGDYLTKAK